jgi:hypothetical protein
MTIVSSGIEPGLLQREVAPSIRILLESAMKNYADKEKSEILLRQAFNTDPSVLDTYVVYYKFYFYHRLLLQAEQWVYLALEKSALQGNFDRRWVKLDPTSASWNTLDGPERIYLYSLKALAFLRMKQGDFDLPEEVLNKLKVLDPQDQVGWSVVAGMRDRLCDNELNDND